MPREISAGIIIYRYTGRTIDRVKRGRKTLSGPRFLILYHGHGYWNFPKGKIEAEEKSFGAALREIREETGLSRNDLKFNQYFKEYERFFFWRGKQKIFKIVIFYLAETQKPHIRISEEHEGYGWFTYKEASEMLGKHKDGHRVLYNANEFLRKQNLLKHRRQNIIEKPVI